MPKNPEQADSEIHENQLLNFLVNTIDEEVDLDLAANAETTSEDIYEILVGGRADEDLDLSALREEQRCPLSERRSLSPTHQV